MPTLIGTSGWQYADWRGRLYPEKLPQRLWLEHYAEHFATVEVNNAFYRLPEKSVFEGWRDRTPSGFCVAVKASRYLTHIKRLREPAEPVGRLMERAAGLGGKLGPILLQLPPTLQADVDLLDACLGCFPTGIRLAVEPRHESWWTPGVRDVLERRGAALCWADRRGRPVTPLWRTATWGYVRLHEGAARRWPWYGTQALHTWVERLAETWPDAAAVYVYFNNDPGGAAVENAATFARQVQRAGRTASTVRPPPRGDPA
ncbi:MAG: DUF72 domain-containing protein [Actinomycetota bacterium]|nr:DUF72 domain-containing protein [Actinomycetota bacterium]